MVIRTLLALTLSLLVASPALAKSASKSAKPAAKKAAASKRGPVRFATYAELMSWPKKKRAAYLRGLTEILVIMERAQMRYEIADNSKFEELKEYIAILEKELSFLPEAQAQNLTERQIEDRQNKIVPVYNGEDWTCGNKYARFVVAMGTCVITRVEFIKPEQSTIQWAMGKEPKSVPQEQFFFPRSVGKTSQCPSGSVEKAFDEKRAMCIPRASWDALSLEQKRRIDGRTFFKHSDWNALGQEKQAIVARGTLDKTDLKDDVAGTSGATAKEVINDLGDGPENTTGIADTSLAKKKCIRQTGGDGPENTDEEACVEEDAASGAPNPEPAAGGGTCYDALACNGLSDEDKKTAIAAFRADKKNVKCIAAGYIKSYSPGKERRAGGCAIPKKGADYANLSIPADCGTEALCNPALFCTKGKLKASSDPAISHGFAPICVPFERGKGNPPITELCLNKFKATFPDGADKGFLELNHPKTKKLIKVPVESCGDLKTAPEGLAFKDDLTNLLNDTASQYAEMCVTDPNSQALFCTECNVIAERLKSMDVPCQAAADTSAGEAPAQGDAETTETDR